MKLSMAPSLAQDQGGKIRIPQRGIFTVLLTPPLADAVVTDFFHAKRDALLSALDMDTIPPICSEEERWQDRKCAEYCRVAEFCDHGQAIKSSQAVEVVA